MRTGLQVYLCSLRGVQLRGPRGQEAVPQELSEVGSSTQPGLRALSGDLSEGLGPRDPGLKLSLLGCDTMTPCFFLPRRLKSIEWIGLCKPSSLYTHKAWCQPRAPLTLALGVQKHPGLKGKFCCGGRSGVLCSHSLAAGLSRPSGKGSAGCVLSSSATQLYTDGFWETGEQF